MASVKKNLVYSVANMFSGLLYPLVTFPYATRIMQADGIGQVNFFTSIVNYIILFVGVGIPVYATREIARVRDEEHLKNKTAIEILTLHLLLTVVGYIIVLGLCLFVPKVQVNIPLFLIISSSIFFTTIGCEWFYQGIEEFKYITIRNLLVKIFSAILLFIIVKDKSDLILYGIITIIGSVGNNALNFLKLRQYISISIIKSTKLKPFSHFVPSCKVFVLNLIISLYIDLNPIMIGFMKDVTAVGLFTAASKIAHLLLGIPLALQAVMLPRMSNLVYSQERDEFNGLCQRIVDFIFTICFPLAMGLIILAPSLIFILCGETFSDAVLPLIIMSPIIPIIGLSGAFGWQILYPQGKESIVILATSVGAISNILLNLLLIPSMSYNGAAVATLVAEFLVTLTLILKGHRFIPVLLLSSHYVKCIIGSLLMGGACYAIKVLDLSPYYEIVIIPLVGVVTYSLFMIYIVKDSFAKHVYSSILGFFSRSEK